MCTCYMSQADKIILMAAFRNAVAQLQGCLIFKCCQNAVMTKHTLFSLECVLCVNTEHAVWDLLGFVCVAPLGACVFCLFC